MAISKQPCVYCMSSGFLGTLYIGVTSDLVKRAYQHKTGFYKGFTDKYAVNQLVYYELHDSMEQAITREKQMKKWNRKWKVNLISSVNPEWRDLYDTIVD